MGNSCSVSSVKSAKLGERARFELLTRHCWDKSSKPERCRALVPIIQERFPVELYAEFLYKCHCRFRFSSYGILVGQQLITGLAEINDHEFTLRILRETSKFPCDAHDALFPFLRFPICGLDDSTIKHIFRVLKQANEPLERFIARSAWYYPGIVLSEMFKLGDQRSKQLDNLFFSLVAFDGITHLCRFLKKLGLPDPVLADVVSHGVDVAPLGEVRCDFPHMDMVRLILQWNVFQGSHANLSRVMSDMVGPFLTREDKCNCRRWCNDRLWIRAESCWCMLSFEEGKEERNQRLWSGVFVHFRSDLKE